MKMILDKIKVQFAKEKFSIGLDIGTSAVKVVKLRSFKDEKELCGFEIVPSLLDLTDVLKKIKILHSSDSVNIAVSGSQTVIRYVNFPKMNAAELRQALKFEAQKHIPFSLAEVNLDGFILRDDLPDNKMLVLIAAVKKELISQRLKIIQDSGFHVNLIDIDSVALANAFNFNFPKTDAPEHKTVALLNIGASVSNLNILENEIPRLSRDIHIAGNNFTEKIIDIFAVDFSAAEKLKISPEPDKLNKVNAAVESVLANLASEVRTSFDYYESQSSSSVTKIYLSGGGSRFNQLKSMLNHFLNIEVDSWDPFKGIKIAQDIDKDKLKGSLDQLAIAMGLALHS